MMTIPSLRAPEPAQVVICDPTKETVAGKNYPTIALAKAYCAAQSPSVSNRWGIKCGGNISENISLGSFINLICEPGTRFTGTFTSDGALTHPTEYVIYGGDITNLAHSDVRNFFGRGVIVSGGTPSNGGMILTDDSIITGGDFGSLLQCGLRNCIIEGGIFPSIAVFFDCENASLGVGNGTFNGGTFSECVWFGAPVFNAGTYNFNGGSNPDAMTFADGSSIFARGFAIINNLTMSGAADWNAYKCPRLDSVVITGDFRENDFVIDKNSFGTGLVIQNATDRTKQLDFDLSGFATANKRTCTPPDKDFTLDDVKDSRMTKIYLEGLNISNNTTNPTYQIDIIAGDCRNDDDDGDIIVSSTLTADITASGANGLDTGSEASNTWYFIWVIYNPTTDTEAALLSLSNTNPTMPSGYTKKRLVGEIKNDSAGDFLRVRSYGKYNQKSIYYDEFNPNKAVLLAGSAVTPTIIDCSPYIPSTSQVGIFAKHFRTGAAGAASNKGYLRPYGYNAVFMEIAAGVVSNDRLRMINRMPTDSSQRLEYAVDNANNDLWVYVCAYITEL